MNEIAMMHRTIPSLDYQQQDSCDLMSLPSRSRHSLTSKSTIAAGYIRKAYERIRSNPTLKTVTGSSSSGHPKT